MTKTEFIHIDKLKKLSFINELTDAADESGNRVYIVGGYIRDLILGRTKTEIDLMVVGDGPEYAKRCAEKLNVKDLQVYGRFGTAHFRIRGIDLEFVGARKESYKKESRNPEVAPASFEEDISRRDFTINTLAVCINSDEFGRLYDLFNGIDDIEEKLIRTPLDPFSTFSDDPLRILRAFRFAAQLGFTVHEDIKKAAQEMSGRLTIVAQERITDELMKILASDKPSLGLIPMYETGIFKVIFPELDKLGGVDQRKEYHHKDVFYHTMLVVDNLADMSSDLWLRLAGLLHDIAKPKTKRFEEGIGWTFHGHEELGARMVAGIFKRLKLPFSKKEYTQKLVRLHLRPMALVDEEVTDSAVRRLIVEAEPDIDDLFTLCEADITSKNPAKVKQYHKNYSIVREKVREVREKDKLREFQSPVRGDTIMEVLDLKPSKTVGKIKTAIEEAILEGEIGNNYEEAYEYMLRIKDDFLNTDT